MQMLTFKARDIPPHFGKHQWTVAALYIFLLQLVILSSFALLFYGVVTANPWIIAGFIVICLLQSTLGRWNQYTNFVYKFLQPLKYFTHYQIIHEEQIPDEQKTVFGAHPHSVLGLGILGAMHTDPKSKLSNITHLISRAMLNTPVIGGLLKIWGVESVNASNMKRLMREGKSIGLLPGGFEQATITSTQQMRIWIENRKGFVKYSLEHGYTIRPVLIMGQHQAYSIFQPLLQFRLLLNRLKFPALLFWNWKTGMLVPWDFGMSVIVGRGISGGELEERCVSQKMIDDVHGRYKEQILRVYGKHKHLNGDKPIRVY